METIPTDVRAVAVRAAEVLVCGPALELTGFADALQGWIAPPARLELHCPPATSPGPILQWLNRGYRVFEVRASPERSVVFDRQSGFHLPDWSALPDPFGAACRLAWSRTAAFVTRQGTVIERVGDPSRRWALIRLDTNPHLWWSLSAAKDVPVVGQAVTCLGRHDFLLGFDTPLVECVATFLPEAPVGMPTA